MILAIIVISVLPGVIEFLRQRLLAPSGGGVKVANASWRAGARAPSRNTSGSGSRLKTR